MTQRKQQQIINAIDGLAYQLNLIKSLVTDTLPENDWIAVKEFALITRLKPKTITNYAGKGLIKKIKKNRNGQYLIHISELTNWQE
ncbi:hypothetical protein [Fodinibius sp.]|uniref:hypothetical protein n=1 Tax=Fodinibius sp. TaxID=1872440 RepID=UPI002ACE0408|nr:hypothetical protein [Fodinibius sp.]MDZ7660454.1 hypothetical protein [Fodinibius sp.]